MSTSTMQTTKPAPAARRRRAFTAPLIALATATLMFAGPGAAHASGDPDPVGDLVKKGQTNLGAVKKGSNASVPSRDAPNPTPANDDDSPGHETANPQAPDHGSSHAAQGDLGGQEVANVADGNSTVNDDDSTSADSTLLAVGGNEVIGSHASSDGDNHSSGPVPQPPICDTTNGEICLNLLYSESNATDDGDSSDSSTSNGVFKLCLGGSDPSGARCTGPAQIDLAGSESRAHRNQRTGRTTTSSDAGLASVCLRRAVAACTVRADAVDSEGNADSNGATKRRSEVIGLSVLQPAEVPGVPGVPGPLGGSEPFAFSIPMDCPTAGSLLCIFGNQGETYHGDQLAGTAQTALEIYTVDRAMQLSLAQSETLAHNDGGRASSVVRPPKASHQPAAAPQHAVKQVVDGILPNTGGVWSGLLALGLGLFASGALATAWGRRRVTLG